MAVLVVCCEPVFSDRPADGKRSWVGPQTQCRVAREVRSSLRNRPMALPKWGSMTRRSDLSCGLAVERTATLTGSRTRLISRPARDIFPLLGGFLLSPIAASWRSHRLCHSGPAELGPRHPHAVHDDRHPTRRCDHGALHAASLRNLDAPRLQPGPFHHSG